MTQLPLVCSVVLTYNNFADTDEAIRSLRSQDYARHEVIVVDNGSSDGSPAELERRWRGEVRFVATGRNLGISGGYNAGIRAALAAGAEYVVTCNNDIVADPAFIGALLEVFTEAPEAGVAVPIVVYFDRPEVIWFARVTMHPVLGYTRNRFRGQPLARVAGSLRGIQKSDFVPTCATMLSRRALEEIGLLDDRFFFGHDDVDMCLRARKKGYACVVLGRPLVKHKVSVTSGVRGSNVLKPATAYTHAVGSVLIGAKHFRGAAGLPFLFGLLALRLPYNVFTMALAGQWRSALAYLRGLGVGLLRYGPSFVWAADEGDAKADAGGL